uniref:Uncharacterized protein n=1 Tax=Arundo donax TaxID=35708 RepID=A0A0A9C6N2_ARUDO
MKLSFTQLSYIQNLCFLISTKNKHKSLSCNHSKLNKHKTLSCNHSKLSFISYYHDSWRSRDCGWLLSK